MRPGPSHARLAPPLARARDRPRGAGRYAGRVRCQRRAAGREDTPGSADPRPPPPAPTGTTPHYVPAPGPLESYGVIAARDLFNPAPAGDGRLTDGLLLWGVGLHGARGHAVIEDVEARHQELYRVGDTVRGARIIAIAWDRGTLERHCVDT